MHNNLRFFTTIHISLVYRFLLLTPLKENSKMLLFYRLLLPEKTWLSCITPATNMTLPLILENAIHFIKRLTVCDWFLCNRLLYIPNRQHSLLKNNNSGCCSSIRKRKKYYGPCQSATKSGTTTTPKTEVAQQTKKHRTAGTYGFQCKKNATLILPAGSRILKSQHKCNGEPK